jgi:hypothetical protein
MRAHCAHSEGGRVAWVGWVGGGSRGRGQRQSGHTGEVPSAPVALFEAQGIPAPNPAAHLVAKAPVEAYNHLILLPQPLPPLDVGVQVVVPPVAWHGMGRVGECGRGKPGGTASSQ